MKIKIELIVDKVKFQSGVNRKEAIESMENDLLKDLNPKSPLSPFLKTEKVKSLSIKVIK